MTRSSLFWPRAQRGFTLIELMVAVTIGLALTIVVASLFLHSRSTYGTTDDLSRMQENLRYTQVLLTRMLHHASFTSTPNVYKNVAYAPANSGSVVVFDAAQPGFVPADGGSALVAPFQALPDSFTVRFQGSGLGTGTAADGTVSDCVGRPIDAGQMSVNTLYIKAGQNGNNALWCTSTLGVAVVDAEVVPDVENMQLVFGEDLFNYENGSAAADGSVERWVPAGALPNANKIVAVRVALLFSTASVAATVVTQPNRTYDLNGNVIGPFLNNDKKMRRAVTMTVNLRNRTF